MIASISIASIMSNFTLFSFWKELEQYRRLKARRQPHTVATIKIISQHPSCANMIMMQQLAMRLTRTLWVWIVMPTQLVVCYLQLKGYV